MEILKDNITKIFGQAGIAWLQALPNIIQKVSMKWELSKVKHFDNLTHNYVASAITADNRRVAVKICCDFDSFKNELKTLQHFQGKHYISLIDYDEKLQAILLELADPGISLLEIAKKDQFQAITIYAGIISSLYFSPQKSEDTFPATEDWLKPLYEGLDLPAQLLQTARKMCEIRQEERKRSMLLHGDLHHKNIMLHDKEWKIIDPKGVVGEIGFEIGAFIINPIDQVGEISSYKINTKVNKMSDLLQLDESYIRQWAFIRAVLGACWCIQDNLDPKFLVMISKILECDLVSK